MSVRYTNYSNALKHIDYLTNLYHCVNGYNLTKLRERKNDNTHGDVDGCVLLYIFFWRLTAWSFIKYRLLPKANKSRSLLTKGLSSFLLFAVDVCVGSMPVSSYCNSNNSCVLFIGTPNHFGQSELNERRHLL